MHIQRTLYSTFVVVQVARIINAGKTFASELLLAHQQKAFVNCSFVRAELIKHISLKSIRLNIKKKSRRRITVKIFSNKFSPAAIFAQRVNKKLKRSLAANSCSPRERCTHHTQTNTHPDNCLTFLYINEALGSASARSCCWVPFECFTAMFTIIRGCLKN